MLQWKKCPKNGIKYKQISLVIMTLAFQCDLLFIADIVKHPAANHHLAKLLRNLVAREMAEGSAARKGRVLLNESIRKWGIALPVHTHTHTHRERERERERERRERERERESAVAVSNEAHRQRITVNTAVKTSVRNRASSPRQRRSLQTVPDVKHGHTNTRERGKWATDSGKERAEYWQQRRVKATDDDEDEEWKVKPSFWRSTSLRSQPSHCFNPILSRDDERWEGIAVVVCGVWKC